MVDADERAELERLRVENAELRMDREFLKNVGVGDGHGAVKRGCGAGSLWVQLGLLPRPHPKEFRDDVVAVARRGEAPIAEIARDFGISESCLRNWLQRADVEDGDRPGPTGADSAELRELKRRNRLLEQENEVPRRAAAFLSQANLPGR